MVIKTEMYPWGDYKQMSYSHEEEKLYTENYYTSNNNGSTMQMVRPNPPCISTPHQPPYNHRLAGKYHHDGHQHGHKEKQHYEGSLVKNQKYYGDGHMVQETKLFSSDRLVSEGPSHGVMAPNKHETKEYSVHYFELKNLDD